MSVIIDENGNPADNAPGGGGGIAAGDLVKDSDTSAFMQDVIEASKEVPVIVDFWAPWCGPCKQLGPMLEKAVQQAGGAVRMVKINVDENQQLAQQLQIQSIPMVYAFYQGQPVDGFAGGQPESEIKSFVDRLTQQAGGAAGGGLDEAMQAAQSAVDQGDLQSAADIYQQVLAQDPQNGTAIAGLVRVLVKAGDLEQAKEFLDSLDDAMQRDQEVAAARAALELAETTAGAGDLGDLKAAVEKDPADLQARYDLALALAGAGERDAAADALLEIVRRDKAWNDEAARKQLLKLFEAWGAGDPATVRARKRLSSLLFA